LICGAIDLLFESTDFEAVRAMIGSERGGAAYIDRGSVIYFDGNVHHSVKGGVSLFLVGNAAQRASGLLALYTSEGMRVLDELDESLALILLDKRRPSISLIRGKNERIYYAQYKNKLLFSSEKYMIPYAAELQGRLTFAVNN